jgi:hypothetical protein
MTRHVNFLDQLAGRCARDRQRPGSVRRPGPAGPAGGLFFGPVSVTIPFISEYRGRSDVPTPIEQAVNVFVSLSNRRRLEDMKLQRERAVLELQGQSGVSVPIRQLEDEIAMIDAGLEKLPPY